MNKSLKATGKLYKSVQMYTLRDFTKTREDLLSTLGRVAAAGYDCVQITPPAFITVAELADELGARGLRADSVMARTADVPAKLDEICRTAEILGTDTVRTDGMPGKYMATADGFREYAGILQRAADLLKARGLKFMYHNHVDEFTMFGNTTGMDIMLSETDNNVMIQPDVHHIAKAGFEPSTALYKFEGRCEYIHMQGYAILPPPCDKNPFTVPVGMGNLSWEDITAAAIDIGVCNFVAEQDWVIRDAFAEIEYSALTLKKLLD